MVLAILEQFPFDKLSFNDLSYVLDQLLWIGNMDAFRAQGKQLIDSSVTSFKWRHV